MNTINKQELLGLLKNAYDIVLPYYQQLNLLNRSKTFLEAKQALGRMVGFLLGIPLAILAFRLSNRISGYVHSFYVDDGPFPFYLFAPQTKAEEWRATWAESANRYLQESNHTKRLDHKSYKRQGISKIPTIHLGVAAHQMEQRGICTERGDINRAIKLANAEIEKINATLQMLEIELEQLKTEVKTDIPITPKAIITKPEAAKNTTPKTNTATAPKSKSTAIQTPATTPKPKHKTLKEVDLELNIVETKLSRLDHASSVIMSYNHKIQDIERNLSSAGFFERRKMQKEISSQVQKRNAYQKDSEKKYGNKYQLEKEKSKLLIEKTQIENATGVIAI